MKKLFLPPLFVLVCITVKCQGIETLNDILKDSIILNFNRGQYERIYEMGNGSFKSQVKEEVLTDLLKGASDLGKIIKTEKIDTDENNISKYRLFYKEKSLELSVRADSKSSYDSFGLTFYQLPVNRNRTRYLFDNPLKTKLDSVVQNAVRDYMMNENVAGLSVGILQNGNMFTYNFGETKKGNGQMPLSETIYEIGSISKTFTGILLANAVKQEKIKLNDDIGKYLTGSFSNLQFNGKPIQIVHLSNHTSRLPSQPKIVGTKRDPFDPAEPFSEKTLLDILEKIKLDTLPGTKEEYSNFGVSLLGYILEKAFNQNYEQLLAKYITNPYKMTSTKVTLAKADYKKYAQGYDVEGNATKYWRNKLAEPAGGIRSTTKDMLFYIAQQLNAKAGSPTWLSHQLTFGDIKDGRGLNWGISTTKKGHTLWGHAGGTDGFSSLCLIYPELKSGIILLTNNGNHDDQAFYDIAKAIYLSWVK